MSRLHGLCVSGILAIAIIAPTPTAHAGKPLDRYQVLRVTVENESQLRTLMALDEGSRNFEIWSDRIGSGDVEVRVSPTQRLALDAAGLTYEVHIDDLHAHMDELFAGADVEDFFGSYRTYDEHVSFMNDLVTAYPDLAEMHNLGSSVEGRPLWAIRITGPGSDKPGVMYHGAQHGNEIMGACVIAYMADHLLTSYDSNVTVQTLVDDVEWFLMPIMNPDGYVDGSRYNANGVDLNRNWDGPGAYSNPFSEPETAAMRDFFADHAGVRAHLDFHTHGRMIMWSWEYKAELCEDNDTYDLMGDRMAYLISLSRGSDYDRRGPVYSTIYPVRGGSVDYSYGMLGMWAITFELGYSHDMPASQIMPTCVEIAPAMMHLSGWISDCNANGFSDADEIAAGTSLDCNENGTPDECEVQPDFDSDGFLDICDPDTDDDGVSTEADVCDFTPPGTPVDAHGRPTSDTNGNCDVDLVDYWRFADCLAEGGPDTPVHPQDACTTAFDYDQDGDVDLRDFAGFAGTFTGLR